MNIILIGFASSGKTTTAEAICETARKLRHIDLDRVIEKCYYMEHKISLSCREIFKKLGANGFCEFENHALQTLSHICDSALSTGGRTPINADNRQILKSLGRIVYLKCGVDTIIKRMAVKGAPLSMGNSTEEIAAEWNKRNPIYSELADIIIDNDKQSPEKTAATILERFLF